MLHHQRAFVESVQADRRADGPGGRKPPADPGELEHLLLAAARREGAAWAALVDRFAPAIRAVARAHRLPPHEIEDVVQTTWLLLLEHIEQIREPARLGGWLRTTAQRESLRAIRRRRREEPTEEPGVALASTADDPEHELVAAERRAAVAGALDSLDPKQRALLATLATEPAPSYASVSTTLGMPIGSIGPTWGRCVTRLRRHPQVSELMDG